VYLSVLRRRGKRRENGILSPAEKRKSNKREGGKDRDGGERKEPGGSNLLVKKEEEEKGRVLPPRPIPAPGNGKKNLGNLNTISGTTMAVGGERVHHPLPGWGSKEEKEKGVTRS